MEIHESETGLGVVKLIVGERELEILELFLQDINLGRQQSGTDGECSWK
jgi:hypothetical protein